MSALQLSRLNAIMADSESVGREELARHLVENTAMSSEQILATLRCSARAGDAAGIAAASAATTARVMLGLPANPQADEEIGRQVATAHRNEAVARAQAEVEAARFNAEYAEGKAAAERLLCRRQ